LNYEEAINILMNERPGCGEKVTYTEGEKCEAYDIAISAIEKQIPKKPIRNSSGDLACLCGLIIQMKSKRKCLYFCHNCGQAIKWGDDD